MGKIITVWGSPGSGKSMFCCILAKALTRDKRKAIIINGESGTPMLPVWLPEQLIETNASIGQVLNSVEIDTSLVASHVTVLKTYPFIGLMGWSIPQKMKDIFQGIAHFETGIFSKLPSSIASLIGAYDLNRDYFEFPSCQKLQSLKLYKNGRADIRFSSEEYARQFAETYLGQVC